MISRRILWRLAGVCLPALLALGAAGGATAQQRGGTLVYTVPASDHSPSMDGHQEVTFAIIHPLAPHYSLFIRLDPTDPKAERIEGDIAENKWQVSADKKTYTFKIKRGIKFHDGSPLTARDAVASFKHLFDPPPGVAAPRKGNFSMVESVSNPDDYTVVFKLKYPSGAFIPLLAQPFNWMYSADTLAKDPNWYKTHVNGSGPFMFKSESPGANWVGVRNPNYFKPGLPYLDGYEAIFTPKENVEVEALRGGRSMIQFRGMPPAARDELKKAMGDDLQVQESTWNCSLFAIPNSFKKPFDDVRVRQALNLAIDRWGGSFYLSKVAVVKTVGAYVYPHSPLAFNPDELETLPGYWRDIDKSRAEARRLLKEAGVPQGFKFKLTNRNTDQPYKFVAVWLIDQWRQVGLDVEQVMLPTAQMFSMLAQDPPQYDVTMSFNCQSIVNPTSDVVLFTSKDVSENNYAHYIDRKADQLYFAQAKEGDPVKQRQIMHEFERYLNDQAYWLTTLWWHRLIVHNKRVHGWNISPSHFLNQQLEVVWLDQ